MATTTNLALPYPAATDLISQGYAQIQSLATGIDGYYGAWTTWSHGTSGFSWSNVTGGTLAGRYKIIGKIVHVHFSITAGTATAAAAVGITLPTVIPASVAGQVYPIPCLLSVGGSQLTVVSARMENGTRGVTLTASNAGANFTAGASVQCSMNWTYEAA